MAVHLFLLLYAISTVSGCGAGPVRGICAFYMRTGRYAEDRMVDRQSSIVDLIVVAVFAGTVAYILSDEGERGPVFMAFVVIGIVFLAAAVSIMYSYENKQET